MKFIIQSGTNGLLFMRSSIFFVGYALFAFSGDTNKAIHKLDEHCSDHHSACLVDLWFNLSL